MADNSKVKLGAKDALIVVDVQNDFCPGVEGYLEERGIKRVFVCGLATDFCVAWTALDARKLGFAAAVIEDACRAIDNQGSLAAAWEKITKAGVTRLQSGDFA